MPLVLLTTSSVPSGAREKILPPANFMTQAIPHGMAWFCFYQGNKKRCPIRAPHDSGRNLDNIEKKIISKMIELRNGQVITPDTLRREGS